MELSSRDFAVTRCWAGERLGRKCQIISATRNVSRFRHVSDNATKNN